MNSLFKQQIWKEHRELARRWQSFYLISRLLLLPPPGSHRLLKRRHIQDSPTNNQKDTTKNQYLARNRQKVCDVNILQGFSRYTVSSSTHGWSCYNNVWCLSSWLTPYIVEQFPFSLFGRCLLDVANLYTDHGLITKKQEIRHLSHPIPLKYFNFDLKLSYAFMKNKTALEDDQR